jgi:hypothetical protein
VRKDRSFVKNHFPGMPDKAVKPQYILRKQINGALDTAKTFHFYVACA